MLCGFVGFYGASRCSPSRPTEDLKKFDVPTLILHGDDDQIVPIGGLRHAVLEAIKNPRSRSTRVHPRHTST